MHYQLPYDSDAFRFAVPAPAIAAAGEGAARTFSGLAYSGEVIRNHGPWSALVLDLDGCELPPVLPVLLGHDRDRRVGLCTLAVREGVLWAEGRLLANPEAAALAADADAGFPWQLSVHAVPHHSDEIAPGLGLAAIGDGPDGPGGADGLGAPRRGGAHGTRGAVGLQPAVPALRGECKGNGGRDGQ